ncbi:hypothetical protein HK101_003428, partial [Irineochytrium annulatum]
MSSFGDQIKALDAQKKALLALNDSSKKAEIEAIVAKIKELGKQKNQASTGLDDKKKIEVKTPKGTRDFTPEEMAVREQMFSTILRVFKKHGAVTIDTPVFELKEILTGKYGEDSKLIYDLQDQGGELCSLRYDLTVPFARYLASNNSANLKRYQIAKVYRRDNPSIAKGRMREFYQCDLDIAGDYGPMIPDAEVLRIGVELLSELNVGDFTIKLNHRRILDGIFEVCGVPADKFRTICSAVDKLDKMAWEDVKKEMVSEKGLDPAAADRIGEYVKLSGSSEVCDILAADARLSKNKSAMKGVEDMRLLFKYLELFGVTGYMSFDLSLARGLDYYTGVIYEAVFTAKTDETIGVGSIASGGRYDELVGMFSSKRIPCVGISIGLERVFAILYARMKATAGKGIRLTSTDVYVIAIKEGFLEERMGACKQLWDAGISAEFAYKEKVRSDTQYDYVTKEKIPVAVIFEPGKCSVMDAATKERFEVDGPEAMVEKVKGLLRKGNTGGSAGGASSTGRTTSKGDGCDRAGCQCKN